MSRTLAGLLLIPCLALAAAAQEDDREKDRPEKGEWSVAHPDMGPYRELAFETTEGTWMSVDVHPDGKTLVFDLLGDIYTVPIEGGDAKLLSGGLPYEVQPQWSPDGKRVLFTSDRGGGDNLWVMDGDGGNAKALTDEDYRLLNNGSWHPSGDYVVARKHYTSGRSIGAGEMWMYRYPDGGKGVQLTKRKNDQQDAGEPEFSADGRVLYWSEDMSGGTTFEYNKDPHGVIYVIRRLDMETGEIRDVIRRPGGAICPQVSPDGKTLAFVRRERSKSLLSVLEIETNRTRDLWDGLSLDQQETWAVFGPYPGFSWTPDGKAIVIWARGHLHRVDVATGNAEPIAFRAQVKQSLLPLARIEHSVAGEQFDVRVVRWPQVTTDGKTAVFQALGHLYRRDLATGEVARVTSQTDHFEFAPWLAPDGTVVYTTWDDLSGGTVRQVALDGTKGRVLVEWPGHYFSASLSPDGKEVVFHRGGADGYRGSAFSEEPGIYRHKPGADRKPRLLTRAGRKPRFTRDGRRVLLIAREGDKSALVSVDRIGSDRRVLVTSERASDYAISPDGKWLAFEELWQTYVVPLAPGPGPVHVSPDMKELPVRRLSNVGGTYLSWTGGEVHWSLGPELFSASAAEVLRAGRGEKKKDGGKGPRGWPAEPTKLGFPTPADAPDTDVYLVGGRIVPMHDDSVIEDGVVHVRGNRIVAVGKRDDVVVPEGANVLDVKGTTVMPGLIDVHSHTGSSNGSVYSEQNWAFVTMIAFGVTTLHDPSNNSQMIYAESELVRAGRRIGPRVLSTGTILYGAEGDFKAVVNSYEDALQEVKRTAAWGPRSVKSYMQPRREQRQQVMKAARELGIMVMPEGGSTLHMNMSQLLDGHTTLEHAIPVAPLYLPELELFARSGTSYTGTLNVGYGGLWGENYWYAKTRVWENERLMRFTPRSVVDPRARRRTLATDDSDYHHLRLAATAADVVHRGGHVDIGGHGQLQGLGSHWEVWMLEQGGFTPHEALRAGTHGGAYALCLENELGSLQPGYLADLIVVEGDPLTNVRDSERVRYTMVNGRLYDARTLEQLAPEKTPLPPGPPLSSLRAEAAHAHCACGR